MSDFFSYYDRLRSDGMSEPQAVRETARCMGMTVEDCRQKLTSNRIPDTVDCSPAMPTRPGGVRHVSESIERLEREAEARRQARA